MKRYIIAALALIGLASNAVADTSKLTTADGWTKITTLPTANDLANNYYVFVDNSNDLMLGTAKGVNQSTKWYSLGVYYQNSVEPTSADINGKTWILESYDGGYAMRNLEYSVFCFQTEWNANYRWDTNDVQTPNGWAKINLAYQPDGYWTIENGHDVGNYIGPWTGGNFTNGAECAGNKTAAGEVGHFQIYAISRTQFKQNLLDNASTSNPVDLTPWYVTNATFDGSISDGWTTSFTANASNWWGSHAFSNLGAENYQQVAEVKQLLTVPNGKYKVALQGASNKASENQAYVFATHDGSTQKTYFTQSTVSTPDGNKWNDMQYNLLLMMQDRSYGQVQTPEITVTTGSLTIGYKNESGHSWDVYDNFKLYCTGVDLSAYEDQLSDLIDECNAFIDSGVVPEACENAISTAITTYNKSYETAKLYSTAIVALTDVLNTYKNNTELQAAYAAYYAFKTKIETLKTGQSSSTELNTFNNAISTATTNVEAATTASDINTEKGNLRSAGLTYISSVEGQFDITFLASQNYWDWKKKDGNNAGIVQDQFLANRPNNIPSFAESYETTCATTGTVLYQTVSDLPAGYYQVGMYAQALYTSGRGFDTEATELDANRSFAFAGDQRTGLPIKFGTSVAFDDLTTLDVNVHLTQTGDLTFGVQKDANGSNWHFAQIASIVYSNSPDLTGLKATRDALVSEAEGLLAGSDADLLTAEQKQALQAAINAGNDADDFDELNTVTLTTLPNAINTANSQIAAVKTNRVQMIAALERFENDYNLADGTDYRKVTMSADAWATLITKVNAVSTALDDVSQASSYGTLKDALVAQMDATDTSLRLFKSYKAMVEGCQGLSITEGTTYAANSYMDTDATEQTAIGALNNAFGTYAGNQSADFSAAAFLGDNLDFNAAHGTMIVGNGDGISGGGNYGIFDIEGWEEVYQDYYQNYYIQTANNSFQNQLYIRSNWEGTHPSLAVKKERMLPIGKYSLSFKWNSDMANMNNLSAYVVDNTSTSIGKATTDYETLTYNFEVTDSPKPFDILFGFKRTSDGNNPAQILADDITLTYLKSTVSLANNDDNSAAIAERDGLTFDVTLADRTLFKDGNWNTICLPFDMTAAQVTNLLGTDGTLMELDTEANDSYTHVTGLDGTKLYLNFINATTITAGKPYLIKWSSGEDIVNPVFKDVTIADGTPAGVKSTDESVTFQGTYGPVGLSNDGKNLYIGASNKLNWPNNNTYTIKAFRAYFIVPSNSTTTARQFVLNFGDDETTGIANVNANDNDNRYFNLNGQRVDKPAKGGLYISKGKKVIIK